MADHEQQPAPKAKPPAAGNYDQDFKRRKRKPVKSPPIEFAVESYEHPVYGYRLRPCWPSENGEATP